MLTVFCTFVHYWTPSVHFFFICATDRRWLPLNKERKIHLPLVQWLILLTNIFMELSYPFEVFIGHFREKSCQIQLLIPQHRWSLMGKVHDGTLPRLKSNQSQLTASRNARNRGITCQTTYWHTDKGDEACTRLCICVAFEWGCPHACQLVNLSTCTFTGEQRSAARREKMEP